MSKAQLDAAEKLIKPGTFEVDYDVEHELGRGRFAIVKRCVNKQSGKRYAVKIVKKSKNTHGRSGREQLLMEISILNRSTHPKMVRLYDVFETRSEMQLILEYAEGGDLHRHCIETDIARTEKEICYLIRQILEAVRYLHTEKVVHLDLKPDNILLAKKAEVFPEIRLIDFGLSRSLEGPYSQFDIVGTAEYVSPEVLAFDPIDYGSDMWSIGVVTYVLLSGISPFAGDDVMETYANIGLVDYDFDCEEFDDISDAAIDFIEKLLLRDPKKRMSCREALEHEWIKQLDGGVSTHDVILAQQAKRELLPDDVELSPLHDEEIVSSGESDASSLEKSSEVADEEPDSGMEEEMKSDETIRPCEVPDKDDDDDEENEDEDEDEENETENVVDTKQVVDTISSEQNEEVKIVPEDTVSNEENEKINIDKEADKVSEESKETLSKLEENNSEDNDKVPINQPESEPFEKQIENEIVEESSEDILLEKGEVIDEITPLPNKEAVVVDEIVKNTDHPKRTHEELPKKYDNTPKSSISDKMAKFSTKPNGIGPPKIDKFSRLSSSKSFDTGFLSKDKKPFSISKVNRLERSSTIKTDEQVAHPATDSSHFKKSPEIKHKSKLIDTAKSTDETTQPTEKTDSITRPAEKTDSITPPADKNDSITRPAEKNDSIAQPAEKIDSITQPIEKMDRITKPIEKMDRSTKSTEKMDRITQPIEKTDRITKSTEKMDRITQPIEKTDRNIQPTEKTDRITQHTEKMDSISQPVEKMDRITQPTGNTDIITQPTEKSDIITQPTEKTDSISRPTEKTDNNKESDKPYKKKTPVPLPGKKSEEFSKPSPPVTKIKPGGIAAKMAKFGNKPDEFSGKLSPVAKTSHKFEKRVSSEKLDNDELSSNDLFRKKYVSDADSNEQKECNESVKSTSSSKSAVDSTEQTNDGEDKPKSFIKPKSPPPPVKCKPKSPIGSKLGESPKDESKYEPLKHESFTSTHQSPTLKHKSPTGHKSPTFKHDSPTPRYASPTHRHMSPTPGRESPSRFESPPPRHESPSRYETHSTVRHGSPTLRNESPTLRNESPTLTHESPTRSLETSPKVERKAKSPPPKPKAKPLKKPPEIALKPVRSRQSDLKSHTKEEVSKANDPTPQPVNVTDPAERETDSKNEMKFTSRCDPEPNDQGKALPAKVGSGLKFSLNIGGGHTSGKKLNIGPLISVGSKNTTTKEIKSLHEIPESPKHDDDADDDREENTDDSMKAEQSMDDNEEESNGNADRVSLNDTRGKNESFSRRRGNEEGHRKTYRRLYVTKVRNSKVYEHDFDISTEAAKIVQRVDKDVLQVEVKLKSTDLKLLP